MARRKCWAGLGGRLPPHHRADPFVSGGFDRLHRRNPNLAERFSVKRSQFQRRWYVPHRPQKAGNLAAVMGSVINNMQHNLPDRGYKRIALCTFVGNISVNRVFGQEGSSLLPPLEQSWPVTPKHR